jgi:predicted permease
MACAVAAAVSRAAKIKKTQRGVFSVLFSLSNAGYMGLPVAMAIFGDDGMLFALFYFAANSAFMNSIGYIGIERDGMLISGGSGGRGARALLKQILTPPLIAAAAGFVLVGLGVTAEMLPGFLSGTLELVGSVTSPLALVFVGIAVQRIGLSCVRRIDKPLAISLAGRFVVSPLIMYLVCMLFSIPAYAAGVLVVQTGLPAMVATTIFAEGTGADTDLAARGVVVTTLLSFVTIPLYIAVLGM